MIATIEGFPTLLAGDRVVLLLQRPLYDFERADGYRILLNSGAFLVRDGRVHTDVRSRLHEADGWTPPELMDRIAAIAERQPPGIGPRVHRFCEPACRG